MKDFFISYNSADHKWAEWIAWQLEDAGYTTVLQAWDFRPGSNFVLEMQHAATEAERTIAVLSPNYLGSRFTQPEWAAAFAQDPTGDKGTLLPVRVQECNLKGLLPQIIYVDLVGLDKAAAKDALLAGVRRGRAKPTIPPGFPEVFIRRVRLWLTPRNLRRLAILAIALLVVNGWLWKDEMRDIVVGKSDATVVPTASWAPKTIETTSAPTHTPTYHTPIRAPVSTQALAATAPIVTAVEPASSSTSPSVATSPTFLPVHTPVPPLPTSTHTSMPLTLTPTPTSPPTNTPVPPPPTYTPVPSPTPTHTPVPPMPTATQTLTATPMPTATPLLPSIVNGDFENNTTEPWTSYHGELSIIAIGRDSQYSLRVAKDASYYEGNIYQDISGLTSVQRVFLRAWVKVTNDLTAVRLRAYNTKPWENQHWNSYYIPQSDKWTELSLEYPVDETGMLRAIIDFIGTGPIFVDDVQLSMSHPDVLNQPTELTNGDFENNSPVPWASVKARLTTTDTSRSGRYGLQIVAEGDSGSVYQEVRELDPGQTVLFEVWIKGTSDTTSVQLRGHNTYFKNPKSTGYTSVSNEWARLSLEYPVDGTGLLRAIIDLEGNDPVYVDDIQLIGSP